MTERAETTGRLVVSREEAIALRRESLVRMGTLSAAFKEIAIVLNEINAEFERHKKRSEGLTDLFGLPPVTPDDYKAQKTPQDSESEKTTGGDNADASTSAGE